MNTAICVREISKSFGNFSAVNQLSFTVQQGDIYGFLGPNGSGKSTTLRMMMGLIKPSAGDIEIFGTSLSLHRHSIMRKVGCIIEKPDFYGYMSALDNLKLFARANLLTYSPKQYQDLFHLVGLTGREKDKVKTYSHGMKQRLGLAQALIHDPELIILDEPNTGLDPQGIIDLRNLILQLNQERGKTILFSSHILTEVQQLCNRMVVINKGKSVVEGKVEELLSTESMHVRIELSQLDKAIESINQSTYRPKLVNIDDHLFRFKMSKQEIPELLRFFMDQQIDILRVDYRNELEEYFLKITTDQS
ncbi:MAG: ABC transporter ATP-binding protein [Chitinophagaceae bacterium]|nr:ABC transporter ATP-binding protein [Chitinophagaceae bacterium]